MYELFVKNRFRDIPISRIIYYFIAVLLSVYILVSIKPYIFYAIFTGILIMMTHLYFKKIRSTFLRLVVLPIILFLIWSIGSAIIIQTSEFAGGAYSSINSMLMKAKITQEDLRTSERYGKNTFDIGTFEPTISGILSKAPIAIEAGLYRPHLWECTNPVMLVSGLENSFLLFITLYVIFLSIVAAFKRGPSFMLNIAFNHSLVVFSIIFSVSFAFFIGLTTANFGALVRYKIPLLPFLVASLFIIIEKFNRENAKEKS
jgi:hypothetical protein